MEFRIFFGTDDTKKPNAGIRRAMRRRRAVTKQRPTTAAGRNDQRE
jgi:hypothetical protein